jgi:type IV pilus assembly protein PilB
MFITEEEIKKLMLDYGLASQDQLDEILKQIEEEGGSLEHILISKKLITAQNLGQLIADHKKIPFVSLEKVALAAETVKKIPEVMAKSKEVVIFDFADEFMKVAMANPDDTELLRVLERKFKREIKVFYATSQDISNALLIFRDGIEEVFENLMQRHIKDIEKVVSGTEAERDALEIPVVRIVDTILKYAFDNRASDIHIEPQEDRVIIRFRVDGILHDVLNIPKPVHNFIVSRIKVMSKLRTDEHMAAQDGKFRLHEQSVKVDVRVSIIPITEGEKVVMRLLTEHARELSLQDLGFSDAAYEILKHAMKKPHGMILSTGPTGSGKTTTLYGVMQILNKRSVNISTIEDPVEYDIKGVNQVQVDGRKKLTFANGLRSLLRQDPDVIMVGEIRDEETAGIAINSALTGHLVLSTLHTNDAATTLPRLLDMKIERFLVASSVNLAIAQRLVRRICTKCITSYSPDEKETEEIKRLIDLNKLLDKGETLTLYKGKGCSNCSYTGYSGRVGIFEMLVMSDAIKDLVMENANAGDIKKQAIAEGMTTILEDGFTKAINGATTLEEVLRVAME